MFDLFSDIFALRSNVLTRIDPRAKMLVTFVSLLAVILSSRMALPLGVMAACLLAMGLLRIPLKLVLVRLAAPLATVAVLVVLQSLLTGSTPWLSFSLFHGHVVLMREGALHGVLIGSRVLGAVSVVLLFGSVTPVHHVFRSLRWARFPAELVEVAMLMYRYVFALLDQVSDVSEAQRMRLGYRGVRRSLSSVGALAGTVIVRSIDQAARTHEAMTLRGYTGTMPFAPMPQISRRDRWIAALALLLVAALFAVQEWGSGR